jgi:hypothetical protein
VIARHVMTLALLALSAARGRAQSSPAQAVPAPVPGSELTVTLVTFGQGQEVFERFGHDALWLHDARTGSDVACHWGLFDFNEPHFVARFVSGDTHYSMGCMDARALIEGERRTGRSVTLQRLALAPAQALSLRDFLQWNSREENRYYRYDYFRDNCATRLREALDRALGGAIHRAVDGVVTDMSYRSESVRLTDDDKAAQAGIDLALGRPADRPLTQWESFFIPMRLRDAVRHVRVTRPGGTTIPLVADERLLPHLDGTPLLVERARPPNLVPRYLLNGLLIATVVVVLRIMMISRRSAAWTLALVGAAWWLLCGILGVLIFLAWMATRHVFWAWNANLLLLTPLCLALVVLTPMSILKGRAERGARLTVALAALLGIVAGLLAMLPGGQQNGAIVALFLPVHLALAWALALPHIHRSAAVA